MMKPTSAEMISAMWGVTTTFALSPDDATVGLTSQQLFKSDPHRLSFLFVNLSSAGMYIAPKGNVNSTNGIYIAPNGGTITVQWDRDFITPTLEWSVIGTVVDSPYYAIEVKIS